MNKKILHAPAFMWLLFVAVSLVFVFFPEIDLYVSSLFFDGTGFPMNGSAFEEFFYGSIKPILIFFIVSSLLLFAYNIIRNKNILGLRAKVLLYLVLVMSVAPALLVDTLFKGNWERARPAQIVEFGGEKQFTPAFIISDQGGYSFISGHTAGAFSLLGFALLAKRQRAFWIAMVYSYGALVSFVRVSAGGHFLSDVVTSFFLVTLFAHLFYKLLIEESTPNV